MVAIASTAFIVFIAPSNVSASPRKVIGGHLVAVVVASVLSGILNILGIDYVAEDPRYLVNLVAALSVGLSILLMVVTDTEHAPAAGTALGLVIPDWSWSAAVFILGAAVMLSAMRLILRPKLINLQ